MMRNVLATLFLLPTIALATPSFIADFIEPQLESPATLDNNTIAEEGLELVKRQTGCASGYAACSNLGASGLCCRTNQVCSADSAGHVACCPLNAACTGTIGGVVGATTVSQTSTIAFVGATTSQNGVIISTATQNSFVQQTGAASYVRSTVPNSFYPFAYIPTTYTNAAACSSAYTSCQTDAASCTADLANGRQGVTISAPNGGATITAIASLGSASAASICQSLSSAACSGLQVAACQAFDGSGNTGRGINLCGDVYMVGAGVAVGIAGQMLR